MPRGVGVRVPLSARKRADFCLLFFCASKGTRQLVAFRQTCLQVVFGVTLLRNLCLVSIGILWINSPLPIATKHPTMLCATSLTFRSALNFYNRSNTIIVKPREDYFFCKLMIGWGVNFGRNLARIYSKWIYLFMQCPQRVLFVWKMFSNFVLVIIWLQTYWKCFRSP